MMKYSILESFRFLLLTSFCVRLDLSVAVAVLLLLRGRSVARGHPFLMPSVTAGAVNIEYQLELVRDGAIQHFVGYLPEDQDAAVAAVSTDIRPRKKVAKSGLNLSLTVHMPNGTVPENYADWQRVQMHL